MAVVSSRAVWLASFLRCGMADIFPTVRYASVPTVRYASVPTVRYDGHLSRCGTTDISHGAVHGLYGAVHGLYGAVTRAVLERELSTFLSEN